MYSDVKNKLNFPNEIKENLMESGSARIRYFGNTQDKKWGLRAYDIIVQIECNECENKMWGSLKIKDEPWRDSYGSKEEVIKELNQYIDRFFNSLSFNMDL